jgi:hypothetical protein
VKSDSLKETIARGVADGLLAYVGKDENGRYDPFLFNTPFDAQEVELSDEMYIVTAAEAKKRIEPPKLTTLSIHPSQSRVEPGKSVTLTVQGRDQHGQPMAIEPPLQWSAQGGAIDDQGVFRAGSAEGQFAVTASTAGLGATASVTIARPSRIAEPTPLIAKGPSKISWQGTVPAQKWSNFYTKVLARFVNTGDLRINVSIEVTCDASAMQQKIGEAKQALRELGLSEDVNTS